MLLANINYSFVWNLCAAGIELLFKVILSLSRKVVFESPSKLIKNVFYLMLATNWQHSSQQTGQQIITIHILSNISRSIGNQAVKFSHLITYNMFFLKKNRTQNEVEKLVPDSIWISGYIALDQQSEML